MFDSLDKQSSFHPILKGLPVMVVLTAAAIDATRMAVPSLPHAPLTKALYVHLRLRPKRLAPHTRSSPEPKISRAAQNQLLAGVASAEWTREVAQGRGVDYPVTALDSLPVLRSFGVLLAFDTRLPRGTTYLLNLATGACWIGTVPNDLVVRELEGFTTPDIELAKQRVERELGQPVRVFALYPPELYLALRGYADEALRRAGMRPTGVQAFTVRLRLIRPREFTVVLER